MTKRTKTVGMLMALLATSAIGQNAYAASAPSGNAIVAAQSEAAKGTVLDATGEPVIGATVMVKGDQTKATVTDIDGNFTLNGVKKGTVLRITSLGYTAQEVAWNGGALNVTLNDDSKQIDEVVVTALGIKRERKALGYAIQDVKGDALVNAHENNVANALTGKIAGVQITRSSNGPGGSSKILLRGNTSVTGLNQPLIVVDGIPMDNFTGADNNDFWNNSLDYGNGLADINPEDIESMSVLKGASAAALYGSRAGNGVILITTKSGKQQKGLGITVTGTITAETLFTKPEIQSSFGQGTNGVYSATSGSSWGEAITGQSYTRYDGQTGTMGVYDNLENYFSTGTEFQENVTLSQMYGKTSIYASFTNMNNKSMSPGAKLARTNMMLRGVTSFGKDDAWTFDGKVQYIRNKANNRPLTGHDSSVSAMSLYTFPRSLDITEFENYVDENNKMIWWNTSGTNPYWASKKYLNEDNRDRFLMNASLKYRVLPWLTAEVKAGTDMYTMETSNKTYAGSSLTTRYGYGLTKFYENNFSFLLTAQKDNLFDKLGGTLTFGGNLMQTKKTGLSASTSSLVIEDMFSVNNGASTPGVSETYTRKKINSLYGTIGLNYDGWAFLDATFRNDWSSALSKDNRSFFYPSISASWLFTEMFNKIGKPMPTWFTYGKIRASYAEVGNDMDPYQLYNLYSIGSDSHLGSSVASSGSTLYNSNVKNELIKSWEVGLDLKFLDNRLGVDFTWYKSNATNQLLNLPMNTLSGYSSKKINAGDIQNQGFELMLSATPVRTKDFSWDLSYNLSHNENKIKALYDGVSKYKLGGYDNLAVYATVGGNYGEIWGTKFLRVEDETSEHYGKLILTADGLPQATTETYKIGDQQADFNMGLTNTFRYKDFSLSFLIDARIGGEIFSGTLMQMESVGTAAMTAPGGKRDNMVVEGVYRDDNGNYVVNAKEVTPEKYWGAVTGAGNLGIGEANIYDATNVRLRNITLSYNVPAKFLAKTVLQSVRAGFTVTNVWMISSKMHGLDPESVYATSTNATGFEYSGLPTTRSFVFNVSLGF